LADPIDRDMEQCYVNHRMTAPLLGEVFDLLEWVDAWMQSAAA
jgi:hypothetical protein